LVCICLFMAYVGLWLLDATVPIQRSPSEGMSLRLEDLGALGSRIRILAESVESEEVPCKCLIYGGTGCETGYRPVRGLFSPLERVLVIGKIVLDFLSISELDCVLGHEISHRPSRFLARLYYWSGDDNGNSIIGYIIIVLRPARKFVYKRFRRFFSDKMRMDEIHADRAVIEAFGLQSFAAAVIKMYALAYAKQVWMPVYFVELIRTTPEVISNYTDHAKRALAVEVDPSHLEQIADSQHASIRDRIKQLPLRSQLIVFVDNSASSILLGEQSKLIDCEINLLFRSLACRNWIEWNEFLREDADAANNQVIYRAVVNSMVW